MGHRDGGNGHGTWAADWLPAALTGLLLFGTAAAAFFMAVFFREDLGFSGAKVGVLFAGQAMTGMLAAIPVGVGNDRVTSRLLVAVGLVLQAAGLGLLVVVRSFGWTLAAFLLYSAAANLFRMSLDLQVLKTDTGERTGIRVGLYQAGRFAGMLAGVLLSGYLLAGIDFSTALVAMGGYCALLSLLSARLPPTPVGRASLAAYFADLKNPRVLAFSVWLALFATHWGAEFTSYTLFLRSDFGLTFPQMGWYLSAEYAAISLTVLLLGRRVDRGGGLRTLAFVGLLASGFGHIVMVWPCLAISLCARVSHGMGDGMMFLVFYVGLARLFPAARLGGNSGVVNTATLAGMVLGSLAWGPLGES